MTVPALTTDNDQVISQGCTYRQTFIVVDSAGVAIDITGFTFECMFRWLYSDVSAEFDLSTSGGEITITDATNGVYEIHIDETDTAAATIPAALPGFEDSPAEIYFDCRMTDTPDVFQVLRGTANFYRSATQ